MLVLIQQSSESGISLIPRAQFYLMQTKSIKDFIFLILPVDVTLLVKQKYQLKLNCERYPMIIPFRSTRKKYNFLLHIHIPIHTISFSPLLIFFLLKTICCTCLLHSPLYFFFNPLESGFCSRHFTEAVSKITP